MHEYVINTFLLFTTSVGSKQLLCFVRGQVKKGNKNLKHSRSDV